MISVEVPDGLVAFDLGADMAMAAREAQQRARQIHVGGVARERHGDVVSAFGGRELDVFAVLVGERGSRDAAAAQVHALAIRELAAGDDLGVDARARHLGDLELDQAIIEQQDVARLHVLGQIQVGATDDFVIAGVGVVRRIEREGLAVLEIHLLVSEALDADLGTPEIREDADVTAGATRRFVHQVDATTVLFLFAVGEVHTRHVEAGTDHFGQDFDGIGGRT